MRDGEVLSDGIIDVLDGFADTARADDAFVGVIKVLDRAAILGLGMADFFGLLDSSGRGRVADASSVSDRFTRLAPSVGVLEGDVWAGGSSRSALEIFRFREFSTALD